MDYGKILSRAWEIIWKHKILWLFGFLASCGNGASSSSSNLDFPSTEYRMDTSEFSELPLQVQHFFLRLIHFFEVNTDRLWVFGATLVGVVLLLVLLSFFLRVLGQVGLVRGVMIAESDSIEADEKLSFKQTLDAGLPFFWRLAALRLLIFLAVLLIFGLTFGGVILLTAATFGILFLCLLPLICLFVPFAWAVSVIIKQAELAMIAEDLSIPDALRRGYEVVRKNLGDYVIMALILLIGGGIAGFVLALPQFLAMAPIFAAVLGSSATRDWSNFFAGLWIAVACLVAYWPVLLILRSILTSFIETSWLLTYLKASRPDTDPEEIETIEPELEPA
jgi:hypothetical protein